MKILFITFLAFIAIKADLMAAEAGMPQLNPKYWASQVFWLILVFSSLYLIMSKIFIPKIRDNLNDREDKIKNDLDDAKNLKEQSENKISEYNKIIEEAKKEVQKIFFEEKNKLNTDIKLKKSKFDNEIEKEIQECQKEVSELKRNSIENIIKVSEEITSKIIEDISGDKLNESSIKAAIVETSKNKITKYL
jgi:F-type H+-transporting ATPase subunit b